MLEGMNSTEIVSPLRGIARRELLAWMWLLAATATAAKATHLTYGFVRASRAAQQTTSFDVGTVADLPAPEAAPRSVPEGRFWLAQTQQGVAALNGVCTHLDCLLGWDDQAHVFACPCHGSRFDPDGRYVAGPAPRDMDHFAVAVVDAEGAIVVSTDFAAGVLAAPVHFDSEDAATSQRVMVDIGQKVLGAPAA
jgi:cytochrome b6-f complex iron-sulfur subunit